MVYVLLIYQMTVDAINTSFSINLEQKKEQTYQNYLEILDQLEQGIRPDIQCLINNIAIIKYCELENYDPYKESEYQDMKNSEFIMYIGSGVSVESIINNSNKKIVKKVTGEYKVIVPVDGNKIYFILPSDQHIDDAFLNGFLMPLQHSTYDGYNVYSTISTYTSGIYKIQLDE